MDQLPTIRDAVADIARGELTPTDLVEDCLHRIGQFDGRIHAWVLVDEDGARREAARLTELARQGELVGPLHGVPIGVKDIIDVAGMPTRAGSPLCDGAPPAERDALVVSRLRAAGAIILGKTVTTEWACFDPPPTRNPWSLEQTPGGSSSGSAAAVALQMCMAALGTQTGGSIIRPAAYCGVCGLKPGYQPRLMDGIAPVSFHLDHVGPLARCVDDLQLVDAVMADRDVNRSIERSPPVLSLVRPYFLDEADQQVRAVVEDAWRRLAAEANVIGDAELPDSFGDVRAHHWRIMAVEAAENHRERFTRQPDAYGPKVASLVRAGLATSAVDYAAATTHLRRLRLEMMRRSDLLLVTPATPTAAPGLETTGDARFNAPWSFTGQPAVTVPCGLTTDGMPVGLQLVGRQGGGEDALLGAARWIERRIDFGDRPALLADSR